MNRKNFAPESVKHINHKRVWNQFHDMLFGNLGAVPKNMIHEYESKKKVFINIYNEIVSDIRLYKIEMISKVRSFLNIFEKRIMEDRILNDKKITEPAKKLVSILKQSIQIDVNEAKNVICAEMQYIVKKWLNSISRQIEVNWIIFNKKSENIYMTKFDNKYYTIDIINKDIKVVDSNRMQTYRINKLYERIYWFSKKIELPDDIKPIYE